MPLASHTSFVRHLSIASADAITPLPVYGMCSVSSAPCTVPSSPKRPCNAMKTRAKPSCTSSGSVALRRIERVRVDAAFAQRLQHRVARQQRDLALGRRAAHQHCHLAEVSGMCRHQRRASPSPVPATPSIRTSGSSVIPVSAATTAAHTGDQRFDVRRARRALRIDDEIRVLLRHARAADRVALEPAGFDQARCMIARRIAEHAAGVRQRERLRRDAPGEQRLDARAPGADIADREAKPGRREDIAECAAIAVRDAAIADRIIGRRAHLEARRCATAFRRARRGATFRRRSSRRSSRARRRPCPVSRRGIPRPRSRAAPRTARASGLATPASA